MTKLYAIGDIHGCFDELQELMRLVFFDIGNDQAKIVFLGDYVDRGPKSAQVVDYLDGLRENGATGVEFVFLKGNHEDMLMKAIFESPTRDDLGMYYLNGGFQTEQSYQDNNFIYADHKEFYYSLKRYHRHGDFFFVHAGLAPASTLERAMGDFVIDMDPLLWAREWNDHDGEFPENVFVVHGHTPVSEIKFLPNQINIDTGCVFGKSYSEQYGRLTAVRLDGRTKEEIKVIQVRRKF
jgi:serine/threonine protein phosphatase 1